MLLNTVYSKALIGRKQRKTDDRYSRGKRLMDTNSTKIVTANLKAFMPLHRNSFFLISFLESSGWVFYSIQREQESSDWYCASLAFFKLENVQPFCHMHYDRALAMVLEGICPARWLRVAARIANEGNRKTGWKIGWNLGPGSLLHCLDPNSGFVERNHCASHHPCFMSGLEIALTHAPVLGVGCWS